MTLPPTNVQNNSSTTSSSTGSFHEAVNSFPSMGGRFLTPPLLMMVVGKKRLSGG